MKHIKLFEEFITESQIYSGKQVNQHIKDITPEESDLPDYFMKKMIQPRKFRIEKINLKDLLKDSSFKEYYDSKEKRYDDDEVSPRDLDLELVVVDGELMDGYSRASELLRRGEKEADAYVAIEESYKELSIEETEFLINEHNDDIMAVLVDSIKNRRVLEIEYVDGETVVDGPRLIEPHALGRATSGNILIRAWVVDGTSKTAGTRGTPMPGWRLFRFDRIKSAVPNGKVFKTKLGYNSKDARFVAFEAKIRNSRRRR
jgi:predicted DNA-binding transcriptional regulator YafY